MVDFGSRQGLSDFEDDGVAVPAIDGVAVPAIDGVAVPAIAGHSGLCRGFQKSENAAAGRKMLFVNGHELGCCHDR